MLLVAVAFDVWNKKRTAGAGGAGAEAESTPPPPDELVAEIEQTLDAPGTEALPPDRTTT